MSARRFGYICPECGEGLPTGETCPCQMINDPDDWEDEGGEDDPPDD